MHAAAPRLGGSFFLVDPLDGTKEFVAGRDEYTVNLALVTDGAPIAGIIGAPALGLALARPRRPRRRALRPPIAMAAPASDPHAVPPPASAWIAAVSRSHGDAGTDGFLDRAAGAVRERSARR